MTPRVSLISKVELRGHDEQDGAGAEPYAMGQMLGPQQFRPASDVRGLSEGGART